MSYKVYKHNIYSHLVVVLILLFVMCGILCVEKQVVVYIVMLVVVCVRLSDAVCVVLCVVKWVVVDS